MTPDPVATDVLRAEYRLDEPASGICDYAVYVLSRLP